MAHRPVGILPEDAFDGQPFVSDALAFVAQARIDNRDELLARLGVPRNQRLGDGDVLGLAYRRWGEDCVHHAFGDFAYVAWHRDSGRISAGVDPIGMVPLYYAQNPAGLLLSTQLGALLAYRKVPRDLNLKALGLLAAPKIEAGTTPYAHISRLLGGERLTFQNGTLGITHWWRPDSAPITRYRDPRDYAVAASELFGHAVKARLRARDGIAATMSGGLDSTLVASSAARALAQEGGSLTAYTSVPEPGLVPDLRSGWDADDSPFARSVAALHGNMAHVLVTPGERCALDIVPPIHERSHTPVRNGANHVWMTRIAEAMEEKGQRVLLVGEKGNAAISTESDWYIAGPLRELRAGLLLGLLRSDARRGGRTVRQALFGDVVGWRMKAAARRLLRRPVPRTVYRAGAFLFTQAFRAAVAEDLSGQPAGAGRAAFTRFATAPIKTWAADSLAQWGIERRDPCADRRLLELLLTFPAEGLFIGGLDRGLARAMGEGLVPHNIRFRQTRGEQVPEMMAIIAAHRDTYLAALESASSSPAYRAIFDVGRVHQVLDRICEGTANREQAASLDRALDVGLFLKEAGA